MTEIHVVPTGDQLADDIARRLTALVVDVRAQGRRPTVVLTGGTIANQVYERLDVEAAEWAEVDWYWGDERFVPAGHEDRNDQQARDAFLDRAAVPAERVHAMPAHGCSDSMAAAADDYADALPTEPFDLVLLGVGPDGHVASLFPHHDKHLHETRRLAVEVFDSPKPPPQRITLTFAALNHARAVWLLVSGDGKAEAVARALAEEGTVEQTPARGVGGTEETLWLLDEAAASLL
ncbi:hypothetical protein ASD11_07415 [Aeromicrobium sp. Root495]|uniref:6-phosphogluconolactonase n=1 Tax=Aeromicrobium sp. Root495 TaxID=1736550 RepID=UPI0006FEAF04|nr:6-phosphogluconolactonase [Aeromicrobium sp. Root495]KQY59387.1 hypothetical protein ASD11_07415 [Aeromicrobium sp. Root495]